MVLTDGGYEPERDVAGTNRCEIDDGRGRHCCGYRSDYNLVKGASGQTIQAMNLMHGFDETWDSKAHIP